MSSVTISISGMAGAQARIDRMLAALTAERMEAAGISGAMKIVNEAKRNAPVLSGTLRRSIHVGGHTDLTGGIIGTGRGKTGRADSSAKDLGKGEMSAQKVNIRIGTDLEYAARIEYGFSGADSRGRHYNQPPKPYLRPAFDEHKDAAVKEVGAALKILIEKALR